MAEILHLHIYLHTSASAASGEIAPPPQSASFDEFNSLTEHQSEPDFFIIGGADDNQETVAQNADH